MACPAWLPREVLIHLHAAFPRPVPLRLQSLPPPHPAAQPGQLTRIQRFAYRALLHVAERPSEHPCRCLVGAHVQPSMRAGPSSSTLGSVFSALALGRPMLKLRAAHCACAPMRRLAPSFLAGALESEVRRTFGNNPDVSKALRVLAEQGKGGHWGRAVQCRPCGDTCAATLGQAGGGCAPF